MKQLILLFILIFGCQAYAFDIVYPKRNNVTINAKSTFFIGSSDTPITINGKEVPLHPSGGFAYVVDLKEGENTFFIESEHDKQRYVITKPAIKSGNFCSPQFKSFNEIKNFYVINDNSPLRTTPVDAGINRLSHLQRNIILNVDGEKGGFYRVVLDKNKFGWIAKTSVKPCENYINKPALLKNYEFSETKGYYEFVFHLDKYVPYEIIEGNPLKLKLYNVTSEQNCSNETECAHNYALSSHIENNTYTKEFPIDGDLAGYSGKYSGNDFIWKIRKPLKINPKKPFKNITVVIDAGHGGSEYGAIGCLGDKEKDINLKIAQYLEEILKKQGANVIMTRESDMYLALQTRVDMANYNDAQIFISIHGNALPDGLDPNKKSGVGVYYYYNQSKNLAETILNTMAYELELNNDNTHQASLAVVRNTNALSVLIETAYVINPDDNSKLVQPEFQRKCARSIANGLEIYLLDQLPNK